MAFSGERLTGSVPVARYLRPVPGGLADERAWLTVFHHLVLHDWHRLAGVSPDEHADRTPRGYFARHDGRWWLVNLADEPFEVLGGGTADAPDGAAVPRQASVEIVAGLRVRLSPSPDARVLHFEFLRA